MGMAAAVALRVALLAAVAARGMRVQRSWSEAHWCELVRDPHWPLALGKEAGQEFEPKGRFSSNLKNLGHVCTTRGAQSKCHRCEEIACGAGLEARCAMQVQGVEEAEMLKNVEAVSDFPWAVGGRHRADYGGASHVCLMLSGGTCLRPSAPGFDFGACRVRCWGWAEWNATEAAMPPEPVTFTRQDPDLMLERNETDGWIWDERRLVERPQGQVRLLAGPRDGARGHRDGPAHQALFDSPTSTAVDAAGNVYVVDSGNHCIRRIDGATAEVSTLAGVPGERGMRDGDASTALFDTPRSITLYYDWGVKLDSRTGTPISEGAGALVLVVSDSNNHRLRRIVMPGPGDVADPQVETLAGRRGLAPEAGYSDGDATEARFNLPGGIAADDAGIVFVADTHNHLIRRVSPDGDVFTLAGLLAAPDGMDPADPACPPPCLRGVPGQQDGRLRQAQFFFPSDVAIGEQNTVLVIDANRVRQVTRNGTVSVIRGERFEDSVTTVAGATGDSAVGKSDGEGSEAEFNAPGAIAMDTNTGRVFVADTGACRIRRITPAEQVARPVSCGATAVDLVRPSGCSSYDPPVDSLHLQATDVCGNVHYNYARRAESGIRDGWAFAERAFLGRQVHRCQGVPPPVTGLTSTGATLGPRLDTGATAFVLDEDTDQGTALYVRCPAGCAAETDKPVFGSSPFTDDSSVCRAALHAGVLNATVDGGAGLLRVVLHVGVSTDMIGSHGLHNVTSHNRTGGWLRTFAVEEYPIADVQVATIAGHPAAPLEDGCGTPSADTYDLPLRARFRQPQGITIPSNTTLSDSQVIYIADTGNHAIRTMTATCAKVCENGGACVGDEQCLCADGWEGDDCTVPVCSEPCSGPRQLCTAPDSCSCVPGYGGFPECDVPLCVQDCHNGGVCAAPDTCACQTGWMDANCTTPICEQTCGNGANCTAPNRCTCPSDWSGHDCRTPVCRQTCQNGGACTAPDTCTCPPDWSGHDCSLPVCTQGFAVPDPSAYFGSTAAQQRRAANAALRPLAAAGESLPSEATGTRWRQFEPCDEAFERSWCEATGSFDCTQDMRDPRAHAVLRGAAWRSVTGFHDGDGTIVSAKNENASAPSSCVRIEVAIGTRSPFSYELEGGDGLLTPLWRFPPSTPYGWNASFAPGPDTADDWAAGRRGWRASGPTPADRMVAHVRWTGVQQGVYVCANGGNCTAPGVCACAPGWIGFDCRTPVCEQGYYEPPSSADPGMVELERGLVPQEFPGQGLYECSIRSVTEWENESFLFEHPNYYSRYMDHHPEEWGPDTRYQLEPETPMYWDGMGWPHTYLHTDPDGNHTNRGWTRKGYWERVPDAVWRKGKCTVEFARQCPGDPRKQLDVRTLRSSVAVADTQAAFRPVEKHTDAFTRAVGRWAVAGGECVDHVVRGCKNNGTCVAPNTCECAPGWTGPDCTVPVCEQACARSDAPITERDNNGLLVFPKGKGWCTLPNTCTCERGWTGHDCSVALCAQECNNDGKCTAPDTCTCARWRSSWWDKRRDGGQPLFQDQYGEPQLTGWTGYDCATPICVQAERFVLNNEATVRLGGYGLILHGHEPYNNLKRPDLTSPPYNPFVLSNDIPPVKQMLPFLREHNKALWDLDEEFFEEEYRLCRMTKLRYCLSFPGTTPLRPTWSPGDGEVVRNDGRSYQSGCKSWSNRFSDTLEGFSEGYLCNVLLWEQGDYDEGRYIRQSNDATSFLRRENLTFAQLLGVTPKWYKDLDAPAGEGVYKCYNYGSCIAPDTCTCPDGYEGDDCATPQCRHRQSDGKIVSCLNDGTCAAKDECHCVQTDSVLHLEHPSVKPGKTGYNGTDCSIPMCMQGTFDPTCRGVAPGGEGCFRCLNGGNCTAPDFCTCPPEWTGHDCGTPICTLRADDQIVYDLQTSDVEKIHAFELDPCQTGNRFFWEEQGIMAGQGNCTAPNTCTCTCTNRAWLDEEGEWTDEPWKHPLGQLPPRGTREGTLSCVSGFEGTKDRESGLFKSCHLVIYEPQWWERFAITLIVMGVFLLLVVAGVCLFIRRRIRQHYLLSRAERRLTTDDSEVMPLKKRRKTVRGGRAAVKKKRRTTRKVA